MTLRFVLADSVHTMSKEFKNAYRSLQLRLACSRFSVNGANRMRLGDVRRAGSGLPAPSYFFHQIPLVPHPLFRSTPLTESLEQAKLRLDLRSGSNSSRKRSSAFRKRSSNQRNLKTPVLSVRVFVWTENISKRADTFDILKFSLVVRLRGHKQRQLNYMFIHFLCLCPLGLTLILNFNISKVHTLPCNCNYMQLINN